MTSQTNFADTKADADKEFDAQKEKLMEAVNRRKALAEKQIAKKDKETAKAQAETTVAQLEASKVQDTADIDAAELVINSKMYGNTWYSDMISQDEQDHPEE